MAVTPPPTAAPAARPCSSGPLTTGTLPCLLRGSWSPPCLPSQQLSPFGNETDLGFPFSKETKVHALTTNKPTQTKSPENKKGHCAFHPEPHCISELYGASCSPRARFCGVRSRLARALRQAPRGSGTRLPVRGSSLRRQLPTASGKQEPGCSACVLSSSAPGRNSRGSPNAASGHLPLPGAGAGPAAPLGSR